MSTLREKLATHGFESNDDYSFPVRCFLESPTTLVRALNIEGNAQRRKTAFATALAHALEIPRILYYDFTERNPALPDVILPPSRDEMGREEPPIPPLDQVVSEACAFSEGEPTALILDQLQGADFREHLRIHRLIAHANWGFRDASYHASRKHLLLFLISEEPLYHALQTASYRLWINRVSLNRIDYNPSEFGLGAEAIPLFSALMGLFEQVETAPTRSEMEKLLWDIRLHVRTTDHLRLALYGRLEDADRRRLYDDRVLPALTQVVQAIEGVVGSEVVEVGDAPQP